MKIFLLLLPIFICFGACDVYDETLQSEQDRQLIEAYVISNGLVGTFDGSGVFIAIQDSGMVDSDTVRKQNTPNRNDTIQVVYTGYLLDGTQIGSSGGQPVKLSNGHYPLLNELLEGWQEGLPYFQRQAFGEIIVPSPLAYGPYGTESIEPNSILRFEIEVRDFY